MGFFSFLGRLLFASFFLLSAWQIALVYAAVHCTPRRKGGWLECPSREHLISPDVRSFLAMPARFNEFGVDGGQAAKELGPKLDVALKHISSKLGLAVPDLDVKHVVSTIIALKGIGGILFIFGSSFGAYLLLLQLAILTPIIYDFYNFDPTKPKFEILLNDFAQNMAFFGALLFFVGMKNSFPKRSLRKKTNKTKAA